MTVLADKPRQIRENVSLAGLVTYRIGGPARWFLGARSVPELARGVAWAKASALPVFILGGGSNLLIDDRGFPGLVIRLEGEFTSLEREGGGLVAGSGVRLKRLGRRLTGQGVRDYLFMTGIPGTVGGAVRMNAGTREGEISGVLGWAEVMDGEGAITRLTPGELEFSYRASLLSRRGDLILLKAAFLPGEVSDPAELKLAVRDHLLERRGREPKIKQNCGSFFRSTRDGTPAGYLIERAGLKGKTVGGAMVALEHANWLVNTGGATSEEVRRLALLVKEEVLAKFGVELEREVIYLPDDLLK